MRANTIHFKFAIRKNEQGEIEALVIAPGWWKGAIEARDFKFWLDFLNRVDRGEETQAIYSPTLMMRPLEEDEITEEEKILDRA